MSLFKRLFSNNKKEEPKSELKLTWIDATANNWGVRLLDMRPFTQTMLSTSKDPRMAENAISYKGEDGTTFFEQVPQSNRIVESNLSFAVDNVLEAGVLFTPATMEHKWAIFFNGESIIFVRSWLREVFVTAKTEIVNGMINVKEVRGEFVPDESPAFTIAILNYLLISHVLSEFAPAPLPLALADDVDKAALWAFSTYGNRAEIGVFNHQLIPVTKAPLRSHSLLHIAVAKSKISDIENYVQNGFNLNALAGDGLAPLHWAIAPETIAPMKTLLELGADPDVVTVQGATPIMNAVQANKISFLEILLHAGASVNATDNRGFTALHRAAEMGYVEIVELLLNNGADKTIAAENHTALSLAQINGNKKMIELLS